MPPKKIIEYTVYIIDCSTSIETKLDQIYSIFSTKVFNRATKVKSSDRHQIILIKDTIEPLTEWSPYQLQQLRSVREACLAEKEQPNEHNHNNFLKAIAYACSSLEKIDDKKNLLIKRIVILSDLQTSINDKEKHVGRINDAIATSLATVYIIGVESAKIPKLQSPGDIKKLFKLNYIDDIKDPVFMNSVNVVRNLSRDNIIILNFEEGFHLLFSYKEQIKAPYPWYVGLGIGTDFRLPVMCYKTIRKHFNVKVRKAPALEGMEYTTDKGWFDLNTHEEVPMDDIVKGYKFHGKFVSFTPEQESEMESKKKTNKCLGIVAFVASDQIPIHLYAFESSMNKVRPDKRSPRYKHEGFRLLVAALRSKNVVAIVKRVYNNGNRPNLFAMFPCPEHNTNKYLLMAQIPYAHQFKDRFYRGVQCKLENTNPEVKENVFEFLDAMSSGNYEDGHPIHPLTENLKFNMNRARQYKYFAKQDLQEDPGDPPSLDIHPYLRERAQKFADNLLDCLEV